MNLDSAHILSIVNTLPSTIIPLFVAIDIFYLMPVYMSMTVELTAREKDRIAIQSILTAFFV